jgi:DNA-binding Lrp family transcriptional regulator
MSKEYADLTARILRLLEKDPGQQNQELARELKINKTFPVVYLEALENQGNARPKMVGAAKIPQ